MLEGDEAEFDPKDLWSEELMQRSHVTQFGQRHCLCMKRM